MSLDRKSLPKRAAMRRVTAAHPFRNSRTKKLEMDRPSHSTYMFRSTSWISGLSARIDPGTRARAHASSPASLGAEVVQVTGKAVAPAHVVPALTEKERVFMSPNREVSQSQVQPSKKSKKRRGSTRAAADGPPPAVLTPEQAVEQVRTLLAQLPNVEPLTDEERLQARRKSRLGVSSEAVQATINAIGASENVAQGVGAVEEEARQMVEETNRWTAVETELKKLLNGVSDANLIRRKRTGILAAKAFGIAKQVAVDNPELLTHVKEIKRLRALARPRKKAAGAPQTPPSPAPVAEAPSLDASTEVK
jgi:hypothetical protein